METTEAATPEVAVDESAVNILEACPTPLPQNHRKSIWSQRSSEEAAAAAVGLARKRDDGEALAEAWAQHPVDEKSPEMTPKVAAVEERANLTLKETEGEERANLPRASLKAERDATIQEHAKSSRLCLRSFPDNAQQKSHT